MTRVARPRFAFSLLELLVVIGIIAILLAILLPVLTKVRTAASKPICMSNLRQAGMLLHAYAKDNGDELPTVYTGKQNEERRISAWISVMVTNDGGIGLLVGPPVGYAPHPYVSNAKLFICPGQFMGDGIEQIDSDDFLWHRTWDPRRPPKEGGRNLGGMSYVYAYVPKGGDWFGVDRYVDGSGYHQWNQGALAGFERHHTAHPRGASTAILIERHLGTAEPEFQKIVQHHDGGGYVLYLDGHVAWVSYPQMQKYQQHTESGVADLRRWLLGVDRAGN